MDEQDMGFFYTPEEDEKESYTTQQDKIFILKTVKRTIDTFLSGWSANLRGIQVKESSEKYKYLREELYKKFFTEFPNLVLFIDTHTGLKSKEKKTYINFLLSEFLIDSLTNLKKEENGYNYDSVLILFSLIPRIFLTRFLSANKIEDKIKKKVKAWGLYDKYIQVQKQNTNDPSKNRSLNSNYSIIIFKSSREKDLFEYLKENYVHNKENYKSKYSQIYRYFDKREYLVANKTTYSQFLTTTYQIEVPNIMPANEKEMIKLKNFEIQFDEEKKIKSK